MMGRAIQDVKYGLRVLGKSPSFTVMAVLVLGLGIGANTAIFSVVNAVLLRPLPFADPERLVYVWHVPPPKSFPGMTTFSVSAANYIDWRRENHVFERMAIYSAASMNLTGGGKPEYVRSATVSSDFFSVLGATPVLGRTFLPVEDQLGHDHEVVLTHAFWLSRFGGDPSIVGRDITLNGQAYRVIGVMGPKFLYPSWEHELLTPLAWTPKEAAVRGEHHSIVIARLKSGFSVKQAQAEMSAISDRLARQYPEDNKDWGAVVKPMRENMVEDVKTALLVLLGAVAFVLLIACANVANLLLARALGRSKEIAIRSALGASRGRLVQQLLVETILLGLCGGAAGLLVANSGVNLIVRFLARQLPRSTEITLDAQVLAFTLVISVLSGLVAGLAPAWRVSKANVNETLKQGLGRTSATGGGNRIRSALVVCEVSLSLMLLAGAGLLIRSLWNLRSTNPGFDTHNVLTMSLPIPGDKYPTPAQEINFWNQALERIRALPGVDAAGAVDDLPFNGGSHQPIAIEGRPKVAMSEQPEVDVRVISTGYLRAMHIPVLRGRDFNDSDTLDRPRAILISQAMAQRFWPGEDAIGKRLTLTFFPDRICEIVGIVGDVKLDGLDQKDKNSALYWPVTQVWESANGEWRSFGLDVVVRTTASPAGLAPAVTSAIHAIDPEQAVLHTMTLEDFTADSISQQRFNMLLLATFAGLALLLAALGIYSVLSYAARLRTREIGIRMALGAEISDVLRLMIFTGMKPALIGLGIGVLGAMALGRVLSDLVFGVKTTDPTTFLAVSVLLAGVALLATIFPAYRATRVDPMRTLRDE
jgi:putative ABC transport system permease protein